MNTVRLDVRVRCSPFVLLHVCVSVQVLHRGNKVTAVSENYTGHTAQCCETTLLSIS